MVTLISALAKRLVVQTAKLSSLNGNDPVNVWIKVKRASPSLNSVKLQQDCILELFDRLGNHSNNRM